jgi:tyrosyl-tRNA synthetase
MFGFKKTNTTVVTDDAKIEEFLTRGVENIFPNKEFLKSKLVKGERLTFFLGVDPTGPTLHLGHAITIKKLAQLQKLGHQIIFLIGDFTAMIGDPTDKTAARKKLTREQVLNNCKKYQEQASALISFSGSNKAQLKFNSTWLGKMNFADVLELQSNFTVEQMLKRDMFARRIEESKPIYIHEFMYPLMQGYDSVAMNVDGEIGGNDQTFNMLAGRDLLKTLKNKEKFVLAVKLLTDSTGKKMGKTEGNMVSLDQTPEDMFGKVMSWSDGLIVPGFELITDVTIAEIKQMQTEMERGANPKDFKMRLATEIVTMIHGTDAATNAQAAFENTFKKGEVPADIHQALVVKGELLSDVLVREKLIASKGEFKRLVEGKGVSEFGTDVVITDPFIKVEKDITLRIGKKRFIKIVLK